MSLYEDLKVDAALELWMDLQDDRDDDCILDASGNGNTGTVNGSANSAAMSNDSGPSLWLPKSLTFDGSADYISIPHVSALNAYPITLSAWIKTTDGDTERNGVIGKYAFLNGYDLFVSSGNIRAWYIKSTSNWVYDGGNGLDGGSVDDGVWHHVAFVVDSSGGELFLDGISADTMSWTGVAGATTNTVDSVVGFKQSDSDYFNGDIAQPLIFSKALTQAEVNALYSGPIRKLGGEKLFISPTLCNSPDGAVDLSDEGNNGTLEGNATTATYTERDGTDAYSLDGTGDYVSVPDDSTLRFDAGTLDFSLAIWFKKDATGVADYLIDKRDANDDGYVLYTDTDNKLKFSLDTIDLASTVTVGTNWTHGAVTVDRDGNATIYIDGVADGTVAISSEVMATTAAVLIGGDAVGSDDFDGSLDDARIYNRTLSATEIAKLASTPAFQDPIKRLGGEVLHLSPTLNNATDLAYDISYSGNNGSLDNGTIITPYKFRQGKRAFAFDGTNDKITVLDATSLDVTTTMSIAFWAKAYTGSFYNRLVSKYDGGTNLTGNGWYVQWSNTNDLQFGSGNGGADIWETDTAFTTTEWRHIAVTFSSGTCKIYIDGVDQAITQIGTDNGPNTIATNSEDLVLGALYFGSAWYYGDGLIDDLRHHDRVLSAGEIARLASTPGYQQPKRGVGKEVLRLCASTDIMEPERYYDFANANAVDIGTSWSSGTSGNFQVTCRFRIKNTDTDIYICGSDAGVDYVRFTSGGGASNVYVATNGSSNSWASVADVSDGEWHEIVVIRTGGNTLNIAIDGVWETSKTVTTSFKLWGFGARDYDMAGDANLDISLFEIQGHGEWRCEEGSGLVAVDTSGNGNDGTISSEDIHSSEYTTDYDAPDISHNGNNGTYSGATIVDDTDAGGTRAFSFDGVNDYVETPHIAEASLTTTDPVTVAFWVKINTIENGKGLVGKQSASYSFDGWTIEQVTGGALRIAINGNTTAGSNSATGVLIAGQWHHVVVSMKLNSIVFDAWVDGVNVIDSSNAVTTYSESNPIRLGTGYHVGDLYSDCLIDDFRIYGYQLSMNQIAMLYDAGEGRGYELPLLGDEMFASIPSLDTAENGNDYVSDLSGHGRHGEFASFSGNPQWLTDTEKGGMHSVEVINNTYERVNFDSKFLDGSHYEHRTYCMWYKPNASTGGTLWTPCTVNVLGYPRLGFSSGDLAIYWASVDHARWYNSPVFTADEWVHIAYYLPPYAQDFNLYRDQCEAWVNGVTLGLPSIAFDAGGPGANDYQGLQIGFPYSNTLNGDYDDARVYDRKLTNAELKHLASQRGCLERPAADPLQPIFWYCPSLDPSRVQTDVTSDLSDEGNNGTLTNMDAATDWPSDVSNGGYWANDFITDDSVNSNYVPSAYPFTVSAWAKSSGGGGSQAVWSFADSSTTNKIFALYLTASNYFSMFRYDGASILEKISTTLISDSSWYHVVTVWTSATDKEFFLNGSSDFTWTTSTSFPSGLDTLGIGRLVDSSPTSPWQGRIDDLRIYDKALTANQIADLYESGNGRGHLYVEPAPPSGLITSPFSNRIFIPHHTHAGVIK